MKPAQRRLLASALDEVRIDLEGRDRLEPAELFPPATPLWLEIGFGGGEHLVEMAARHPETGFIGCEPFLTGVAKVLGARAERGLDNIRIVVDDARVLLDLLPARSLQRIYVLFPDPWPKTRHHKRRIVNPATVAAFARVLQSGGELRLASDDMAYASVMLETVLREPGFIWLAERARDWRCRPPDQIATRYEMKAARAGRPSRYLCFRRRNRESP